MRSDWLLCCLPLFNTAKNSQNSKSGVLAFIQKSLCIRNQNSGAVFEKVRCSELITRLESYFLAMTNCQRGFTATNRALLRTKLLKHVESHSDEDPFVNLKRLSEKERDCSLTFFNWFTGVIELVNAQLKTYWEDGFIVGFIGRLEAEELLATVPDNGAFIVRFSESKLSSVTLSYVIKIGTHESVTASLVPFTCDKLKSVSFPEILQGRVHHQQASTFFTNVYFHEVSDGCEILTCKYKSKAFPPLMPPRRQSRQMNCTKLFWVGALPSNATTTNPEGSDAAETIRRGLD